MTKTINEIIRWVIVGLVFFLPLFFLPLTTEFYLFNKLTLLVAAVGILSVLWTLKLLVKKTFVFKTGPLDLPVLLFALTFLTAALIASPSKTEAFMEPASLTAILALTVFYFVVTNNLKFSFFRPVLSALVGSAGLLGLVAIYQFIGLGEVLGGPDWLKNRLFTPSGGPLLLLVFLGFNFFLAMILFLRKLNQKKWLAAAGFFAANLLIALGLVFTFYQVMPGKDTGLTLPPYRSSWAIAIEAFKQSPLVGIGPGNYFSAFNRFRPITHNNYRFWSFRFTNASNYPLQLLTVGGISVFGAYLFLLFRLARSLFALRKLFWGESNSLSLKIVSPDRLESKQVLLIGLALLVAIQLFLPVNFLSLTLFYLFLGFFSLLLPRSKTPSFTSRNATLVLLTIVSLFTLGVFYFWGRLYLGEYYFRQSLNALAKNEGLNTYNHQVRAIGVNPRLALYRRAYSQTNFALASSLAAKTELSDQDRNNITVLVQQAINEAKVATTLNETDAVNWENLAQIYRNLINFAQGADQWAITAFRQAIVTDPINPNTRVNLGGLFYSLGNYEEAAKNFEAAVNLKPDFANGYYNLANAYKEQKKYQQAYDTLLVVADLIPADSPDFQKVANELEQLRAMIPAQPAAAPSATTTESQLTAPEPLPSPVIEPPLELPEELSPDTPTSSPAVSPTASPTTQPTVSPEPIP